MVKKLVIAGASGNALDMLDVVDAINARHAEWEVAGILDDGREAGSLFCGVPVLGRMERARDLEGCLFLLAIGSDGSYRRRGEMVERMGVPAERFATLVHPKAEVSVRAELGRGVCVNYGVSVGGNVKVLGHVLLGPRVVVGHDAEIGSYSIVAAAAVISGGVGVGRACYIGANSAIRQKVRIGEGALVGMGAVVLKDVMEGQTVVGNPARVLRCSAE